MTPAQIQEQLTWLETVITNLRGAILALSTGTQKSYSVNTGQGSQSVTKSDLTNLRASLQSFMDERDELTAELAGTGGHTITLRQR